MVICFDETGVSPLPPGILVTISSVTPAAPSIKLLTESGNILTTESGIELSVAPATPQTQTIAYSGYTQLGGTVGFTPMAAVPYVATFYGTLGPSTPQSFNGASKPGQVTTVSVAGYRAPFLSQGGYIGAQMQHWPPQRFPDSALQPNGVAYALAYTFAYLLAYFDVETQQTLASERIQTCVASQIDSWAFDFFGNYLLRFPGESDAIYLGRILSMFGPRCAIDAIQQVVQQFYVATALQTQLQQQQNIAADIIGAADISGGADVYIPPTPIDQLIPNVTVWDAQSNPTLAQTYNICPPQFVVQINFDNSAGWFLDYGYLDYDSFLTSGGAVSVSTTPPDPRLGALVNLVKAAGYKPMYAVSQ